VRKITPDELKIHLEETLTYVRRHRAQTILGGQGFSDVPAFSGFKAKAPCNDTAVEAADMEIRAMARLFIYCVNLGTIPDHPMPGIWFSRGKPMGLKPTSDWDEYDGDGTHMGIDVLSPLAPLIEHMAVWAPTICSTRGVEPYLADCVKIRKYSKMRFPSEEDSWVTLDEAAAMMRRSLIRVRQLADSGAIKRISDDYGEALYSTSSIRLYQSATQARLRETAKRARESK